MIMVNGEQRIQITGGWSWVSDDHLHWSDGNEGGSSNDNLRTNVTAKVPSGYRAAVDGYIYMISVDGNDDIVNVSLYSRPLNSSRQEWMKGESARQEQAKALAQEQINLKKAMEAEAARKAAEAAAAAEAQRQAEEEERRRQAEWDAAHPVEAAQRDVNNASAAATAASNQINADNAQINSNNAEINARQPRLDQLNGEIAQLREVWASMMKAGDTARANQFHRAQIDPRLNEREPLQSAVESFQAQNNALSQDVANQTATLNSANQQCRRRKAVCNRHRLMRKLSARQNSPGRLPRKRVCRPSARRQNVPEPKRRHEHKQRPKQPLKQRRLKPHALNSKNPMFLVLLDFQRRLRLPP
ncbi:hypothetical protein [Pantoea cypripedii]|uniref:Uncharacterized protein n=1 Tax=Pantoea cypripedii TaxID=55209 RepID=A0A1X1EH30_PANCY|nr:hypothetical protein [Pantoea cypripedii]MBP2199477.1 chemotaxis protein histidine kinase CheA [Pantoea cypripedii]ORM88225.1 hypothetical protein HA50_30340 [Pantoea cypripedii]